MAQRFRALSSAARCFGAPLPARSRLCSASLALLLAACSGQTNEGAPVDGDPAGDATPGGQSGGEGDGELPADTPCACLSPLTLGRVLEADGCVRVEVTGPIDPPGQFQPGEILGGVLSLACGGPPIAAGIDIAFQYVPGEQDECPAFRACTQARCVSRSEASEADAASERDTSFECNQECYAETEAECGQGGAWQRQTGRFTALELRDGLARFQWAGAARSATLESLASPSCIEEHRAQYESYSAASTSDVDTDAPGDILVDSDAPGDGVVSDRVSPTAPSSYVEPGTCVLP